MLLRRPRSPCWPAWACSPPSPSPWRSSPAPSGRPPPGRSRPETWSVSTSVWTTNPNITSGTTSASQLRCRPLHEGQLRDRRGRRHVPPGLQQRHRRRQLRGEPADLARRDHTNRHAVSQVEVPNSSMSGVTSGSDQMTTSFSSKSELALNDSTDDQSHRLHGLCRPIGRHRRLELRHARCHRRHQHRQHDTHVPGRRPDGPVRERRVTETNAYSGNNGRAAILNTAANDHLHRGNTSNGSKPEPKGVVTGTGSQILSPNNGPESRPEPRRDRPARAFNIVEQHRCRHRHRGQGQQLPRPDRLQQRHLHTKGSGATASTPSTSSTPRSRRARHGSAVSACQPGRDLAGGRYVDLARRTAPTTRRSSLTTANPV